MIEKILAFDQGVTLVGGGPAPADMIFTAMSLAPILVAADGGANHLARTDLIPSAIIGDLDSLDGPDAWRESLGDRLVHIAEQDTTDFEKCLARIDAPFIICVGFLGGRQDHGLAALHALLGEPRPVVLLGADDVAFAPHDEVRLALPVGERVSIYPLRRVQASGGAGLAYPVEGLVMEAGAQIGTSNHAVAPEQSFDFDRPGAVVFLGPDHLRDALEAKSVLFQPPI